MSPNSEQVTELREISLTRDDEGGMIFISCHSFPQLFIAVDKESSLREAIDRGLKNVFDGVETHVFTNGSIVGPEIATVVKLVK